METSIFVLTIFVVIILLHVYRYHLNDIYMWIRVKVRNALHRSKHGGGGKLTFAV